MEPGQTPSLRQVNEEQFRELYSRASVALLNARYEDRLDRWADAARTLCALLGFVMNEEPLWTGMHEAADALASSPVNIPATQAQLQEFLDAEASLLLRRGLTPDAASQIVHAVRVGLQSFSNPTHADIDGTREALSLLNNELCGSVTDWSVFSTPERKARRQANNIAVFGTTGGLLGVATNAATVIAPPVFALSVAGGIAAAIGGLFGYRRRR